MRPGRIVKAAIRREAPFKISSVPVVLQLKMFILDHAPQSFTNDVVKDAASPIHTALSPSRFEPCREDSTHDLAALIAIEDLRASWWNAGSRA